MDKDTSNNGSEGEKSNKNLWLAALIVGILLILMLLSIASIVIWKYFKKENTANQNWAGPSPMVDGNTQEDMNESILGRHRSLSCISTAPIVANELQAAQKVHVPNILQEHSEEASTQEDHGETNMPTLPYISNQTTSFSSEASEEPPSKEHLQAFTLNDETSLPPPPDELLNFPVPPQFDKLPTTGEGI